VTPSSQQGSAGSSLSYTVKVTNYDSASCPATTFNITAINLPTGFTATNGSISVGPSASASADVLVTSPAGFPDSTNTFMLAATDATSNNHAGSVQATYIVFTDLVAPSVTITKPLSGSTIPSKGNLQIAAKAIDNRVVAKMELYVDTKLVKTCSSVSSCSINYSSSNISMGGHTITAKAYDSAGNVGSQQIQVTK
jgi:hypothetical protein